MAARFWAAVLALRLLAAVGVAASVAVVLRIPAAAVVAAAAAGLAIWYVIPVTAVAASLAVGRSSTASPEGRTGAMRLLRVLCAEVLEIDIAGLRMAAEPLLPRPARAGVPEMRATPRIVLVHGIACNRAVWRPLLERLNAAGFGRVHAMNLEPLFADIDAYAHDLLGRIEAIGASGARPVVIVAHSMGGLVARAALRGAKPGTIGRIITVGTPHHGTLLACRFAWASARQMCLGSRWLGDLNERQEGKFTLPLTSLYSLDDNLIVPATSAIVRGARSVGWRGLGHLGLLRSPQVLQAIVSELRQ